MRLASGRGGLGRRYLGSGEPASVSEAEQGPKGVSRPGSPNNELEPNGASHMPSEGEIAPDIQERISQVLMQAEQYSSPHPHPEHLERYAALYPQAPEIVFEQFRKQGDHRREMEAKYMRGSERRANIGQWLAFILVLAVVASGVIAIIAGNPVAGSSIIGVALGGGILLAISGARVTRKTAVTGKPTQRRRADVGAESVETAPGAS